MPNKILYFVVIVAIAILVLYGIVGAAEGISNTFEKLPKWLFYVAGWGAVLIFVLDYNKKVKK